MLPSYLQSTREEVIEYARAAGLDFFEVIFEMLTSDEMSQIASYGGFPTRYRNWRFGMEYDRFSKTYQYGLSRIYELVINNDPCYAYLLESNTPLDQKLVMAHVYAHSDFFKNNAHFGHTNRKMVDEMANHGTRISNYVDRYGLSEIEDFLDYSHSIDNLIDTHYQGTVSKIDEKRDILNFLVHNADLSEWQHDILSIVRKESYYFLPQMQTKIMNEGWATFWHSKIMTENALRDDEVIDYALSHSGTVATSPGRINPYKMGVELFRHIKDRWDKGKFGQEFESCEDIQVRSKWDKHLGLGIKKVFDVRKIYNDIMFLDEFLTEEFCVEQKLFIYQLDQKTGHYIIKDRDHRKVKEKILFSLTNLGNPIILLRDGNYEGKGILYLYHKHIGSDLKLDKSKDTLKALHHIWKRPVYLETKIQDKGLLLTFDGRDHREHPINYSEE